MRRHVNLTSRATYPLRCSDTNEIVLAIMAIRSAQGQVTSDPALALAVGSSLQFLPRQYAVEIGVETGFDSIDNWGFFEGVVLALSFRGPEGVSTDGSAVMVAPGVALTAKHTLMPHFDALRDGSVSMVALGPWDDRVTIWNLAGLTLPKDGDLAILSLRAASDLPPDNCYRQAVITTRTPKIGETVTFIGFRMESFSDEDGFQGQAFASRGVVVDVYPQKRDSATMPWPSFQIDSHAVGAMSGGPVFDSDGSLIGLLSSSLESSEKNGPSFASLLWPIVVHDFQMHWPTGAFREPSSLLNLSPRLCKIIGDARVSIDRPEPGELVATYAEWN